MTFSTDPTLAPSAPAGARAGSGGSRIKTARALVAFEVVLALLAAVFAVVVHAQHGSPLVVVLFAAAAVIILLAAAVMGGLVWLAGLPTEPGAGA